MLFHMLAPLSYSIADIFYMCFVIFWFVLNVIYYHIKNDIFQISMYVNKYTYRRLILF